MIPYFMPYRHHKFYFGLILIERGAGALPFSTEPSFKPKKAKAGVGLKT
jgi:hypothetical protein